MIYVISMYCINCTNDFNKKKEKDDTYNLFLYNQEDNYLACLIYQRKQLSFTFNLTKMTLIFCFNITKKTIILLYVILAIYLNQFMYINFKKRLISKNDC